MSIPSPAAKPPKVHVCPECSSLNLIEDFDQGETICQDCGLVLSQNLMSRGPEWRAFTKEEKDERGRVGIPTSFAIHDKGLSTVIDRVNRDAYGRQLSLRPGWRCCGFANGRSGLECIPLRIATLHRQWRNSIASLTSFMSRIRSKSLAP